MKKIICLLLICASVNAVYAQSARKKPAVTKEASATDEEKAAVRKETATPAKSLNPPLSAEDAEKAMLENMTPGEMHAQLASAVGDWKEELQMWPDPGADATVHTLNCRISMIMDGRFQESEHTGEINGMSFHGMGLTGYDNTSKKFVSTWIDNMSTGIMYMTGTMNEEGFIVFNGEQSDPVSGKVIKVREVYKILSESEHTIEMYNTLPGGREFKSMEIHLRR